MPQFTCRRRDQGLLYKTFSFLGGQLIDRILAEMACSDDLNRTVGILSVPLRVLMLVRVF
jgi:hypothetical protein